MRKKKTRSFIHYTDAIPERSSEDAKLEEHRDEAQIYEQFWERFAPLNLSKEDRDIFWLHLRMGYTMKEVGELLAMPSSTVHDKFKLVKQCCLDYLNRKENDYV